MRVRSLLTRRHRWWNACAYVMAVEAWHASHLSWAQAGMDTAHLVALEALEPLCRTASERVKSDLIQESPPGTQY